MQWSIGSPVRAVGFAGFAALLAWLAYVSIGLSAVVVIGLVVVTAHWVPYVLAGRNRLSVTHDGITDHLRFRTRHYAWDDIIDLTVMTVHRSTHGLVVELRHATEPAGSSRPEFLRASWRPSPLDAQRLLDSVMATHAFRERSRQV